MTTIYKTFERTTTEVLDYVFDFAANTNGDTSASDLLQSGETITSRTLTSSDSDLIVDSSSIINSATAVRVWLSGGNITDSVYYVDCVIITSDSRTYSRSIRLIPKQRRSVT